MTWLRSALRRLGSAKVASAGFGVLVLVTTAAFGAAPRVVDWLGDRTIRDELAAAVPASRDVERTYVGSVPSSPAGSPFDAVVLRGGDFAAQLPATLAGVLRDREAIADSARWTVLTRLTEPATFTLRFQEGALARVAFTAGRPPTAATETASVASDLDPGRTVEVRTFEGAISEQASALTGVRLGDVVDLGLDQTDALARSAADLTARWRVRIVGLFHGNDPADEYWYGENGVLAASMRVFSPDRVINDVRVLMAPDAYAPVTEAEAVAGLAMRYRFRSFVARDRVTMASAGALVAALRQTESIFPRASTGLDVGHARLASDLAALVGGARIRWAFALSLMAGAAVGPATIALVSLGLVALLAAKRRRPAVAAWRTRGASTGQVLRATIGEGVLVALPAALFGAAAVEALAPGGATPASLAAEAVVLVVAVLAVGLLEIPPALVPRGSAGREGRGPAPIADDAPGGSSRRIAAEIVLVALAVAAVVLLRRSEADTAAAVAAATGTGAGGGISTTLAATGRSGVDPLTAVAPTLAAVAAALLAGRLIPLVLRGAAWLAGRGRGLVVPLAMRRAARAGASTAVVLVLFVGTAITVFSAAAVRSLDHGADVVAWDRVGADYRIHTVVGPLPANLDLGTLPGATAVAPAARTSIIVGSQRTFDLLAIRMDAYAAMTTGSPIESAVPAGLLDAHPSALPVVLSASVAEQSRLAVGDAFEVRVKGITVPARVAAIRDGWPTLTTGGQWVVISLDQLAAVHPDIQVQATDAYVAAPPSARDALLATLAASGQGLGLEDRAVVAADVRGRPVSRAVATVIVDAVLVGAAYAALALVAGLVLTGSARSREAGHLRVLGLGRRGPMALLALEFAPALGVALALAAALGLGLYALVGGALGLGALLGSSVAIPLSIDAATLGAVLAVVAVVTAAAIALAAAIGDRVASAAAIRTGIE